MYNTQGNFSKNNNNTIQPAKSPEQEYFRQCMPQLKHLKNKEESEGLTPYEKRMKDQILVQLFERIKNFGFDTINNMTKSCYLKKEDRDDLATEIKLAFMKHIYDYEPNWTTPTTYFLKYFIEAIRSYLQQNMQLSSYDATNIRMVRSAINVYQCQGIPFTLEMISNVTGLSQKVVKSTIKLMGALQLENIDEVSYIGSELSSPEDTVLDIENEKMVHIIIHQVLTEEEAKIFLLRLNLNEPKEMTYEAIAKTVGKDIRMVRKTMTRCVEKLRKDDRVQRQWGGFVRPQKEEKKQICSDKISDLMANDFLRSKQSTRQ